MYPGMIAPGPVCSGNLVPFPSLGYVALGSPAFGRLHRVWKLV